MDLVITEFGVSPTAKDIQRYIKDDTVSHSSLKKGHAGDFSPFVFNALCTDFEIFIKSNDIKSRDGDNPNSKLAKSFHAVKNKENVFLKKLVNRFLEDTVIDLMVTNCDNVEECKIILTTYNNNKSRFDNWRVNLEDIGFELREKKNELYIPK